MDCPVLGITHKLVTNVDLFLYVFLLISCLFAIIAFFTFGWNIAIYGGGEPFQSFGKNKHLFPLHIVA